MHKTLPAHKIENYFNVLNAKLHENDLPGGLAMDAAMLMANMRVPAETLSIVRKTIIKQYALKDDDGNIVPVRCDDNNDIIPIGHPAYDRAHIMPESMQVDPKLSAEYRAAIDAAASKEYDIEYTPISMSEIRAVKKINTAVVEVLCGFAS